MDATLRTVGVGLALFCLPLLSRDLADVMRERRSMGGRVDLFLAFCAATLLLCAIVA